jgi:hypothetical protein
MRQARYVDGEPLVNPFPDEQALFTISAQNYTQYEDNLSPGQIALLKRYPDTYRMPVFTTHRTALYPEHLYETFKKDAMTTITTDGGNGRDDHHHH